MVSEHVLSGSSATAAEMILRGEISARELTEALLARIEAVNPAVNAVVELRQLQPRGDWR